jgi:hypothetical protein
VDLTGIETQVLKQFEVLRLPIQSSREIDIMVPVIAIQSVTTDTYPSPIRGGFEDRTFPVIVRLVTYKNSSLPKQETAALSIISISVPSSPKVLLPFDLLK